MKTKKECSICEADMKLKKDSEGKYWECSKCHMQEDFEEE